MKDTVVSRRHFIAGVAAGAGAAVLSGLARAAVAQAKPKSLVL